ncbi:exonuclease domain-containing protein [Qipengyuania flava]|uniref:exonuclease domain-containing protein n=1 Tax=Qipengyuania flava TaxID=192812 RepID=UPI00141B3A44|nr:exonuclease domain-containing protein [Qipengyuania flava]NIJ61144.1 DNA polymerase-3 subunit epsilon [Qipengyuania flava]
MNTPTTSAALGGADDQIRVLHRITPLEDWQSPANARSPFMRIAVLDLETDGLDPLYNEILEIAVAMIVVDRNGRIIEVEGVSGGLQQPSRPIEPEIERITGITDAMVAGKRLVPQKIAKHLKTADACLAFHVAFDRRHLEMLVPEVGEMPWICAMADVDWHALGFDGRAQGHLLMQAGMFNPVAHRAADDVASLIHLLAHECRDGRTVMAHALGGARSPTWRFEASDLPYRLRKDVYRRGYRFSDRGVNHKLVREADYDAEVAWYRELVGRDPTIVPVDWAERYRADWTWEPVERKVEVVSWRR